MVQFPSQSGRKRRLLAVTAANLKGNRLSLEGHLGFFPADCFGPSSLKAGQGRLLTLQIEGLGEEVQTDIPSDDRTGQPRPYFRRREWVRDFYAKTKLRPGDWVSIEKSDRYSVRIGVERSRSNTRSDSAEMSSQVRVQHRPTQTTYTIPQAPPRVERAAPNSVSSATERRLRTINWASFRFIDLFAGIGGIRLGFESVGGTCVFTSEWDEQAQISYQANFGHQPHGDITKIDPRTIPDHEVLLAGFPCQPFSIIGERKGFGDTRGTLFFNVQEILSTKRPAAFLLENVKGFRSHDEGRTYRTVIRALTELGYFTHTAVLNALHYGVPQRRERTYIVGFRAPVAFEFPMPARFPVPLSNVLEDDSIVDLRLFASKAIQAKRLQRLEEQGQVPFFPSIWHENKGGFIGMHPYSCALRANASYNYLLVNGKRRPSSRENLRLQGFPDEFKIVVPYAAIRAQAGNSVAVPVIRAIAESMMGALRGTVPASTHSSLTIAMRSCRKPRGSAVAS